MASMNQQSDHSIEQQFEFQFRLQEEQTSAARTERPFSASFNPGAVQHDPALPGGTALQRSASTIGMGATPSNMAQGLNVMTPQRALSQQLSPSYMRRTVSNRSEPCLHQTAMPIPNCMDIFGQQGRLQSVSENLTLPLDVGINPGEYITTSYLDITGINFSSNDISKRYAPSAPPSMISTSSASAADPVLMTRENSYLGNPSPINMARVPSFRSQGVPEGYPSHDSTARLSVSSRDWKDPDPSDFLAIGTSHSPVEARRHSSFTTSPTFLGLPASVNMERSESGASAISMKSTNSQRRAREAHERVLQNSKALIAPKPQIDFEVKSVMAGSDNQSTSNSNNKIRYQRPKHPKVHCDQCNDHPDGFRGDHELRRHINAKHEGVVKKFVCRDPGPVGIRSKLELLYPLDKCKACVSRKQYGAYYNAAAHLRRTHFRQKPSRGKSKAAVDEKRGGKGGGDWPSMSELKLWFEEIKVQVPKSGPVLSDTRVMSNDISIVGANLNMPGNLHNNFGRPLAPDYSPLSVFTNSPIDGALISPLSTSPNMLWGDFGQPAEHGAMLSFDDGLFGGSSSATSLTSPAFDFNPFDGSMD